MITKSGAAGLLLLLLIPLILLIIFFASTKLFLPNPQSIEIKKETTKQAQDAIDLMQKKNIESQSVDVDR